MLAAPEPPALVAAAYDPAIADTAARQGRHAEAETLYRARLAAVPTDADARFGLARVLAWQAKFDAAIKEYDTLLAAEPGNSDYWLGKGQALLWSHRPGEAFAAAERARALAVTDPDAWRVGLKALVEMGPARRPQAIAMDKAARARFPQLSWPPLTPEAAAPDAPPPFEATAGASYDSLTAGYAPWTTEWLLGRYRFAPRASAYGRVMHTSRFGTTDAELMLGGTVPVGDRWTFLLEGSASPTGNAIARWAGVGLAEFSITRTLVGWARYRHADYTTTPLDAGSLGLEAYWSVFQFSLAATASHTVAAGLPVGGLAGVAWRPTDRDFVSLRLNAGQENEVVGPGKVVAASVVGAGLEGRWYFHPHWALTGEAGWYRQAPFYDRTHIGLGVASAW